MVSGAAGVIRAHPQPFARAYAGGLHSCVPKEHRFWHFVLAGRSAVPSRQPVARQGFAAQGS